MERKEVIQQVEGLIKACGADLPKDESYDAYGNKPLTGPLFRMTGIDLGYLFLLVERTFAVHIDAEELADGQFNTINEIVDLVLQAALSDKQ